MRFKRVSESQRVGGRHFRFGSVQIGVSRQSAIVPSGKVRSACLTRPSSGRAKAGFASFGPPLKSNVRLYVD